MPKIKVQLIPKEGKGYLMFECESDKIAEASLVEYQGKQYAYMTINGSWKNPTAVFREVPVPAVVSLTDEELLSSVQV